MTLGYPKPFAADGPPPGMTGAEWALFWRTLNGAHILYSTYLNSQAMNAEIDRVRRLYFALFIQSLEPGFVLQPSALHLFPESMVESAILAALERQGLQAVYRLVGSGGEWTPELARYASIDPKDIAVAFKRLA